MKTGFPVVHRQEFHWVFSTPNRPGVTVMVLSYDTNHAVMVVGYDATGLFITDPSGRILEIALGAVDNNYLISEHVTWEEWFDDVLQGHFIDPSAGVLTLTVSETPPEPPGPTITLTRHDRSNFGTQPGHSSLEADTAGENTIDFYWDNRNTGVGYEHKVVAGSYHTETGTYGTTYLTSDTLDITAFLANPRSTSISGLQLSVKLNDVPVTGSPFAVSTLGAETANIQRAISIDLNSEPSSTEGSNTIRLALFQTSTPLHPYDDVSICFNLHDNITPIEMIEIPAGSFMMGNTGTERDQNCSCWDCECEEPLHEVSIGYSFQMSKYEVTTAHYVDVLNWVRANREYLSDYSGGNVTYNGQTSSAFGILVVHQHRVCRGTVCSGNAVQRSSRQSSGCSGELVWSRRSLQLAFGEGGVAGVLRPEQLVVNEPTWWWLSVAFGIGVGIRVQGPLVQSKPVFTFFLRR